MRGSIRRWSKGWAEEDIVEALDNHSGSGGAGPLLAWCCAAQRIADPRKRRLDRRGLWSLSGSMIPFLEEYAERPVRSAMAAALRIVVMQHLRVTWERYADDPSINNALIATEQGRWSFVRSYVPGRMGRRLWTARGWLMQLGAFNETGLSATGNTVLQRILAKCEEAWS